VKSKMRLKLQDARDYLAPLSKEDFSVVFPNWKSAQAAHISAGLSVEESWELFCKEWVRRGGPRVIEVGV
jgi:hypothetical protein